jgi:hypothetical protein
MSKLEIDNDNGEIRVDGYEYASSKVSVKTYGISSEISQTSNSADIRITDNDGYTDNVTVTGGSNVTITRNDSSKFTIDSYNSDTTYSIEASSSVAPVGAKLTLRDSNNVMDNVYIVQGTGIGVAYTGGPDSITVSNAGVTQVNPGVGITTSGQTGNVTVNNDGVTKFNGAKGSVDYYSFSRMTDGYNIAVADVPNDMFGFNAGSGIKVLVDANSDSITIDNDGVKTFNGFNGDISFNAFGAITDGYNTAIADWPVDTFTMNAGPGVSVIVDGYTDSVTIANTGVRQNIAGTGILVSGQTGNVTITNDGVTSFNGSAGSINYYSFGTITDGYNSAVADQANDTFTMIAGSGIGLLVNSPGDNVSISNTGVTSLASGTGISVSGATGNVTIGNTGVTSLNGSGGSQFTYNTFTDGANPTTASSGHTTFNFAGSNGIKVVTSPDTATISMSQTTLVKGADSTIGGGANLNILSTNIIPINNTIEISGIILFAFSPGGATNTFDITLSTSSGTIGANTSKVAVGFTCHAGGVAGSPGEAIKNVPTFTYPQQIANTNNHVIRFSGLFQTDGTTPNSLIINMKNNNGGAAENLVVYAKSFIRYNVI